MAEFIFKQLVHAEGLDKEFEISSAAVSYEEEGNGLYPPAASSLRRHGIPFGTHIAHRITAKEFGEADLVLVMDNSNIRLLERISGTPGSPKVHKLLEYTGSTGDVADPWYTGDFEQAYSDILSGCTALLHSILSTIYEAT